MELKEFKIIDDVNETIENVIEKTYQAFAEDDDGELPFEISFAMPDKSFSPGSLTVNFYLYDIKEDVELRSNEPLLERRADGTTARKLAPARIKLSYLVTAWSPAPEGPSVSQTREEHKLLSKILWILMRFPKIPEEMLAGDLIGQAPLLPTTVVLPNGLKNTTEFWGTFEDRPVKPALEYSVTFSLDHHDPIAGRMVFAKLSEYGQMTSVFRYEIRPPIGIVDHPNSTPLTLMKIEKIPVLNLLKEAVKGTSNIRVGDVSDLTEDDALMMIDGEKTEFVEIKEFVSAVEMKLKQPILFDHAKNTELKKITSAVGSIQVKLAAVASMKSTVLRVTGPDVRNVKIGSAVKINTPNQAEYCQVTEISGPEKGLDAGSDSIIQVGGMVTNQVGAAIAGAEIILLNAVSKPIQRTVSNAMGQFKFINLSRGKYTFKVDAEAQGYDIKEVTIDDIAAADFDQFIFKLETT